MKKIISLLIALLLSTMSFASECDNLVIIWSNLQTGLIYDLIAEHDVVEHTEEVIPIFREIVGDLTFNPKVEYVTGAIVMFGRDIHNVVFAVAIVPQLDGTEIVCLIEMNTLDIGEQL